ncbi:hypothetical protein [Desulfocicer niacini]
MVDPQDLKMDDIPEMDDISEVDPDGEIIELTQIVDDDAPLDDVIELTDPVSDDVPDDAFQEIMEQDSAAFSEEAIRSVLEKIIDEKYGHRMEALFSEMIYKAVEKEMERIKKSFLSALAEK